MSESGKLLIKNGDILNKNGDLREEQNIYIEEGEIKKINKNLSISSKEVIRNAKIIDAKNCVVTPGLVNLHCHSPMSLMRGMGEDVNIEKWFNDFVWKFETKLKAKDIEIGAKLGIVEMLKNGVIAFADHYFHAEQIAKAAENIGIRADIAPTIFEIKDLEKSSSLINKWQNRSSLINFRIGPHAPYTCSFDVLSASARKAEELKTGIHIHVSETKEQVQNSYSENNKYPFQILKETGILSRPTILGHGLWIKEEEIDLIDKNHHFAISPKTYLKLSMGYGNIWNEYNKLPLSIGTDGAASSNTLSPIEQARLFALIGKQKLGAEKFTLKEVWKILMKGHKALNFESGQIASGKPADLVVWSLDDYNMLPANNILSSIIYNSNSTQVKDVIIDGKIIVKNHRIQTLEKSKLQQEVQAVLDNIKERSEDDSPIAKY